MRATRDVAAQVRELTDGRGADIVYNTVGSAYFEAANKSMAKGATQIFIATQDRAVPFDIFAFYRGMHTFVGIDSLAMDCVASTAQLDAHARRLRARHAQAVSGGARLHARRGARRVPAGALRQHRPRRAPPLTYSRPSPCTSPASTHAPPYEAPNHFDMRCLRLQGKEAGPSTQMWMGMSQILPGGHTDLDGSPMEKLYLVLEGDCT